MSPSSITVRDLHLNIPVALPGRERLLRLSYLQSAIGGHLRQAGSQLVVQALKGISFTLSHGERVALMGANGAGKSSLLRAIAGILPASSGEVILSGTVGCLFDVGGGLGQDLTGFECIRHYLLISGLPAPLWKEVTDDVAHFTELGAYLDLPIRTYSDGMRTRLFAALATAWKPDILLVDEGIGAGDQAFQRKFSARLDRFMEGSSLFIIASHSIDLLKRYCTKGIVLSHGELVAIAELDEALRVFNDATSSQL